MTTMKIVGWGGADIWIPKISYFGQNGSPLVNFGQITVAVLFGIGFADMP